MPKKTAAKLCGVPRTTLLDKLNGRVPEEHTKPGSKPTLTVAEEGVLVNYIKLMAEVGYPVSRRELKTEVKKILDRDGRKNPFKDNMPGDDWYDGFCKRHPEIKERKPQALGKERAIISFEMVENWFRCLQTYLQKEIADPESLVRDPRRIFNADESGFPLCATTGRVLASAGAKHVYQVVANDKTQITVMACLNANGDYMPPLIVYPGQRFRGVEISKFPGAIYGHSDKGWMDSELFVQFLVEFVAFVKSQSITFPVLLFVDGHSTHLSLEAAEFCQENGVILYCLLPNATHVLQACDIGLFSPMKTAWKAQLKTWQMENIGCVVTKSVFPGLFRLAWERVATLQNAAQGFKRSGLFPLGPENVDKTKLGPAKLLSPPKECSPPSISPTLSSPSPEAESQQPCDASTPPMSNIDHSYALTPSCSSSELNSSLIVDPNATVSSNQLNFSDSVVVPNIEMPVTSANHSAQAPTMHIIEANPAECNFSVTDGLAECDLIAQQEVVISQVNPCSSESNANQTDSYLSIATEHESLPSSINATESTFHEMPLNCNNSAKGSDSISPSRSSFLKLPPALNPKCPTYISPAFDHLTIPEIKHKPKRKTVRDKLPKAVSGHEAIKILKEREERKKNEEKLKQERKTERERKRLEKDVERE
ncbi:MAG: hypothetical protein AB2693_23480 [Candidatus Thiodiazotropha sp.]